MSHVTRSLAAVALAALPRSGPTATRRPQAAHGLLCNVALPRQWGKSRRYRRDDKHCQALATAVGAGADLARLLDVVAARASPP